MRDILQITKAELPKSDLLQIQKYLEQQLHSVRTIADLALSENDYRQLGIKLKSVFAFLDCQAIIARHAGIPYDELPYILCQIHEHIESSTEDLMHQLSPCLHEFQYNS